MRAWNEFSVQVVQIALNIAVRICIKIVSREQWSSIILLHCSRETIGIASSCPNTYLSCKASRVPRTEQPCAETRKLGRIPDTTGPTPYWIWYITWSCSAHTSAVRSSLRVATVVKHTFCQKSTGNWSIKHKLFIIHPNLFYRLQSRPLP